MLTPNYINDFVGIDESPQLMRGKIMLRKINRPTDSPLTIRKLVREWPIRRIFAVDIDCIVASVFAEGSPALQISASVT